VLDEKGAGLRLGRVKYSEKRGPWSVALFALHQQGQELINLWSALQAIDRPWQPIGRMLAHRIVWPQLLAAKKPGLHLIAAKLE
jgi:hypothetical protein